ncbi:MULTISPECIES: STAS domain-containing protein [Halanaerobium]|jgi:anti-anti-sigma factor|uniref:Anti-sigma factor antagonist n=1 Tax=Halanaerobium saccharolyticum TaxID=43595 RepID=A0A4R6S373_9FIRM|nr:MULTISPECIES: STAS domain-containing protein [Halanaerobium]PUU93796.1 MAG: sulfate transporter/antisigma-factor antagonist STAS [Halanaerobium sp.]PUU95624.1 MAG: sulfate transporter/antisigma-factor antagonist STAS [Halanaerobium sp.]TDP93527.1 anti-sigma B factor antagonist/stage II sporulation protein AA (anti-sigma F factor antagonist) [Halanaerobium saccharolyticum]
MESKTDVINSEQVVISPVGNIDFSNSQDLKDKLLELFKKDYKKVILDFSEVESIDSSGLGKLLLFHKKLKEKEGKLIIRNVESDYIKNMFEMIHLNKVITIEE